MLYYEKLHNFYLFLNFQIIESLKTLFSQCEFVQWLFQFHLPVRLWILIRYESL